LHALCRAALRAFPAPGQMQMTGTFKSSYAARPIKKIWVRTKTCPPYIEGVAYPMPLPKLDQLLNKAVLAEAPERPPYNHGTPGVPQIQALYNDGAVRLVPVKPWAEVKATFEIVDIPKISDHEEASGMLVWEILDKQ
jgi:hypothetical protein